MRAPVGRLRFLKPRKVTPAEQATSLSPPTVYNFRNMTTTTRTINKVVRPRQQ